MRADAVVWVSWPKKAFEGRHRHDGRCQSASIACRLGLVDVKVCAVDEVWSGLKLVVRTALR